MSKIVKMIFGSHLYGTSTENSDKDFKGLFLPSKEDCFLGKISKAISFHTGDSFSKNTKDDIDEETFSLQYFLKLAINGEMIVIDMLHAPDDKIIEKSKIWERLKSNRSKFYTKNLAGYIGYIRKQTAKYGVKGSRLEAMKGVLSVLNGTGRMADVWHFLPVNDYCFFVENPKEQRWKSYEVCGKQIQESMLISYAKEIIQKTFDRYGDRAKLAQANEGIDWKAVSHAFRAGYQLLEIYRTGDLKYPLESAKFLTDIKVGKMHYINDGIQEMLDKMLFDVEMEAANVALPEKVDVKWCEDFILEQYLE